MKITARIVLSLALLTFAACASHDSAYDDVDLRAPEPIEPEGIGTSPTKLPQDTCPVLIYPCGVWVDANPEAADARALACGPADVVVYTAGHTTCSDAVTIGAERYPNRSFVRRVDAQGRALEATCP